MQDLGDLNPGDTIDLKFATADSTGAPTALSSGAISVYKDNSTTESTSGVTLTASFDSRTGMNHVRITTASDGTFYSAGSNFQIVLTAGTVNSVSVIGYVVGAFSLNARSALRPATAGRTLAIDSNGRVDVSLIEGSDASDVINAQADAALADYDAPTNAEMTARTLASADYATATALATVDGVVDAIATYVDTEVAAIKAKTDQLNFGVTGKVDSNLTHVNEVEVTGDGDGTPWGPA